MQYRQRHTHTMRWKKEEIKDRNILLQVSNFGSTNTQKEKKKKIDHISR